MWLTGCLDLNLDVRTMFYFALCADDCYFICLVHIGMHVYNVLQFRKKKYITYRSVASFGKMTNRRVRHVSCPTRVSESVQHTIHVKLILPSGY